MYGGEARQLVGRGGAVHQHGGEAREEVGVGRGGGADAHLGQEVLREWDGNEQWNV